MLTCAVLVIVFMLIAFGIVVVTGLMALAPIFLDIIGSLFVDYFVLKLIFKKKKGGKKGE